jgi:hypothetical protein
LKITLHTPLSSSANSFSLFFPFLLLNVFLLFSFFTSLLLTILP